MSIHSSEQLGEVFWFSTLLVLLVNWDEMLIYHKMTILHIPSDMLIVTCCGTSKIRVDLKIFQTEHRFWHEWPPLGSVCLDQNRTFDLVDRYTLLIIKSVISPPHTHSLSWLLLLWNYLSGRLFICHCSTMYWGNNHPICSVKHLNADDSTQRHLWISHRQV